MTVRIKELQQCVMEIKDILNDLSVLEDYEFADYGEVLMDLRWTKNSLNHRLTTLRMKKEHQK